MTTTLITGANKGLGYQAARRLLAMGPEVWVAARDPRRGAEAAQRLGGHFVQLDVTDDTSVTAAAEVMASAGGVDVLINNAGISDRTPVTQTTAADVRRVFDTNVLGPVRVLQAFTPLLDASSSPVVVNVSSAVGSLGYASDSQGPYAELNLLAIPRPARGCNIHPPLVITAAEVALLGDLFGGSLKTLGEEVL
jgi:NAD(P)-dependent dehydrogenase (short-subunit alcohol dehydrogenase family)